MKIIKPVIEVEPYDGVKIMKKIERACRNCYRSEGNITEDSYKKLITNCINRHHESVLEHEKVTVRMTCDIGCYAEDTKVLTTNGWKYFKDIDVTVDKVYTKTDDDEIKIVPIMSKIEKDYTGDLFNYTNSIIDVAVTPDHNMWVYDVYKRSSKTKIWKFIKAEDMKNKAYKFDRRIKINKINGNSILEIPAIEYNNKIYPAISINDSSLLFELFGWYITDGSVEVDGNYIRCRISQKKSFGRNRIQFILDVLGIDYSYNDTVITIKCPQLNHFIYNAFYVNGETTKSLNMFIPDFIRYGYSNEINSFIDGVIGGNGYTKSSGTVIIYTASKKFAEDLIELLFKLGKNANYHITPNLNKYASSFRQNHIVYAVSIHKNQPITWWNKTAKNFKHMQYNGKVYCLELFEYHKLYVMRNGKTCWCGNCYKDLTRHRIASFSIESTRYCAYNKDKFDNEIKFIEPMFYDNSWIEANYEGEAFSDSQIKSKIWYDSMSDVEDMYMNMAKTGSKPDELRMLLPHSTAAQVYMTANIREWRHILRLRCSKMTHPAIQQILIPLLLKFKQDMPELFDDVEYNTEFPEDKYAELKIMEEV